MMMLFVIEIRASVKFHSASHDIYLYGKCAATHLSAQAHSILSGNFNPVLGNPFKNGIFQSIDIDAITYWQANCKTLFVNPYV
jgi:hypothetical protein